MAKEIVITKRFRNNTSRIYQSILKKFSAKTAFLFLDKIEDRIELISKHPTFGKVSTKRKNVRSVIFNSSQPIILSVSK